MTIPISLHFIDRDDDWRIVCQTTTRRCFIWRNGSFLRSTIYNRAQGSSADADRLPPVASAMLDRLLPQDASPVG